MTFSKMDIFCFSETHSINADPIKLEGFHIFKSHRPMTKGARKASGGMAIGLKIHFQAGVKLQNQANTEYKIMWLKLCETFFYTW